VAPTRAWRGDRAGSTTAARACDASVATVRSGRPNPAVFQPAGQRARAGLRSPAAQATANQLAFRFKLLVAAGPDPTAQTPSASCGRTRALVPFSAAGGVVCNGLLSLRLPVGSGEAHAFLVAALARPLADAHRGDPARDCARRAAIGENGRSTTRTSGGDGRRA